MKSLKRLFNVKRKIVKLLTRINSFLFFNSFYKQGIIIPYGSSISPDVMIGRGTNINKKSDIRGPVKIGKHCAIAGNLTVVSSNHTTDTIVLQAKLARQINGLPVHGVTKKQVSIGNGVWIGLNVTILPNVHVGEGAIIGAGSIVTKDVPPYTIVAGNPAKTIRKRFSETQINKILKLNIFDRSIPALTKISTYLTSSLTEEILTLIEMEIK